MSSVAASLPSLASLVIVALGTGCSEPGQGGGAFGDTQGDVDTRDAVFQPDDDVDTAPPPDTAPPIDTAPDTTPPIDTAPPVDTAPDTTPPDTTPIDTFVPDTTPADTTPADTAPSDAIGASCTYHTDCYPGICGLWITTNQLRCSAACAGDADCQTGQICSKVPGSLQVGYCQDAPTGLGNGTPCSFDHDCRSGVCADNQCTSLCLDESHCAQPGMTCHPSGDFSIGLATTVCSQDEVGSIPIGQECTTDGLNYDSSLCASGHCDLLSLQASVCSPMCKSEADCSPAQECNIVIYSPTEAPDAVPYDPQFTQKTHDAIAGCYTPVGAGFTGDGAVCTNNGDCRSNKCLPLLPDSNQRYCTSFCTSDAQCPGNMACKLEALTLASEWLVAAGNAAPGSWTLVRVCKFR